MTLHNVIDQLMISICDMKKMEMKTSKILGILHRLHDQC